MTTSDTHTETPTSPLLNRHQAAQLLNVAPSTIIRMEAAGRLKPVRLGKCVRYRRDAVEQLMQPAS